MRGAADLVRDRDRGRGRVRVRVRGRARFRVRVRMRVRVRVLGAADHHDLVDRAPERQVGLRP